MLYWSTWPTCTWPVVITIFTLVVRMSPLFKIELNMVMCGLAYGITEDSSSFHLSLYHEMKCNHLYTLKNCLSIIGQYCVHYYIIIFVLSCRACMSQKCIIHTLFDSDSREHKIYSTIGTLWINQMQYNKNVHFVILCIISLLSWSKNGRTLVKFIAMDGF